MSSGADCPRPPRAQAAEGPAWSSSRAKPPRPSGRSVSPTPIRNSLAARGLTAAQILLTLGDTEERRRYLNARNTIEMLLALKAIPVVNENDTVATAEIRYGDNDRLSARVASMVTADCLVLLSDVDGLYTAPPSDDRAPSIFRSSPRSRPRSRRWRETPVPSFRKAA